MPTAQEELFDVADLSTSEKIHSKRCLNAEGMEELCPECLREYDLYLMKISEEESRAGESATIK